MAAPRCRSAVSSVCLLGAAVGLAALLTEPASAWPPPAPANDDCANAIAIGDGVTSFDTTNATTDGPAHLECQFDGQVYHDIWYDYVATCSGLLTVSTCGTAAYDTDLAVYAGSGCPTDGTNLLGCNDDGVGCSGFTSVLEVPVIAGASYKIRVGGWYDGHFGTGDLLIECEVVAGACCFKSGHCQELMEDDCYAAGGTFLGFDTSCEANPCPRKHPGWNWVDNLIMLTKNEPCYWSAHTGEPKGVSPFGILDPAGPGLLPGRPDPDGSPDRVLRGYIIAYAVDANGEEIRWNHLKGDVTIVDYRGGAAWEHNAWSFPVVAAVANGQPTGTPGELNLDGAEYVPGFDQLLLDFQAVGSTALSGPGGGTAGLGVFFGIDTDLTLLPISVDLRQETDGPITTKAHFDIWNEYEVKFSGAYRCITCWDQWRLSRHGIPNHFLLQNLQTNKGKARIDGLASQLCDYDNDPKDQKAIGEDVNDIVSRDASLLGVAAKLISLGPGGPAMAGTNLHGLGTQAGVIRADVVGAPPEAVSPTETVDGPARHAVRSLDDLAPRSPRRDNGSAAAVAGTADADRVSATEKGSLLIFPKVELRWDHLGRLVQDTFIDMSNDFPEDVRIQMYFINGDPPLTAHEQLEAKDDHVHDNDVNGTDPID